MQILREETARAMGELPEEPDAQPLGGGFDEAV
jgi:hypothetical protein